jgi:hypothetical protein
LSGEAQQLPSAATNVQYAFGGHHQRQIEAEVLSASAEPVVEFGEPGFRKQAVYHDH